MKTQTRWQPEHTKRRVWGVRKDIRESQGIFNLFYMIISMAPNTTDADITEVTISPSSPKSPADAPLIALFPCVWGDPAPPDCLLAGKPDIEGS
jgi:hypothetical protein